jgi:lipopolysaccharide biosynthesis protein
MTFSPLPDSALPRLIAFYLPQYHPIPENDAWWGKGFTEWRNVSKARPLFNGHYQPHLPADLGFYDLRLPESREAQAELARAYGIHGFCYYHYWFNGRRILERPFSEVLASGNPDFPFCLCWANENWTRVWDGGSQQILLEQRYSHDDDLKHIQALIPAFDDKRYIRINGKPLFLVYRTENLPAPSRTATLWREAAIRSGVGEIFLARVESFNSDIDPQSIGFDAAVEFAPDWRSTGLMKGRGPVRRLMMRAGLVDKFFFDNHVSDYQAMVEKMLRKPEASFCRFRCVAPSFDNSPRRSENAAIFTDSTPQKFENWLREVVTSTMRSRQGDERIVFINAWNEWGEGNHLEPDMRWGRAYLEAVGRTVNI